MDVSPDPSSFIDEELMIGVPIKQKLELIRPNSPIKQRHSFGGFGVSQVKRLNGCSLLSPDDTNVTDFFTPDSTTADRSVFIDKVNEILNDTDSLNSTYLTARSNETKSNNNSSITGAKTDLLNGIEHVLQHQLNMKDDAEVICISDDEYDTDFLRYQGTQVKYEDITAESIEGTCAEDEDQVKDQNASNLSSPSNHDSSGVFDDTLTAIDRFLQQAEEESAWAADETEESQGCDINTAPVRPKPEPQPQITSSAAEDFKKPLPSSSIPRKRYFKSPIAPSPKPLKKFDCIVSPVSNYINQAPSSGPKKRYFRSPTAPTAPSKTPSPLGATKKFDNITSPISIYIKHGGTTPIQRPFQLQQTSSRRLPDSLFDDDFKTTDYEKNFVIPAVIYKPARTQLKETKQIKLIGNIEAIMPGIKSIGVMKHERRVQEVKPSEESICERLHQDNNLTISEFGAASQDVSFVHTKRAFY